MTKTLRSSIKGALNRSIKPGLLSPAQFRGSTLDLDFAGAKSLKNQIGKKDVVSFTRASSGTYVDGDGLIKTTPVNLLTYSEELDHSSWSGFRTSVTANALAAPDGTQTADLVASTESNINGAAIVKTFSEIATTYTFSVFAKAGTGSALLLRPTNDSVFGQRAEAWFDLSGGTAGTVGDDGSVFTNASSQIVSQGNGWFRCSLTFTVASAGFAAAARLYVVDSNGALSVSNGASIYLWGAQLQEGSTATDYIPTTSTKSGAPRFDHDPATGESLGLLIEESRTNYIDNSNDLSQWNRVINSATTESNTADTLSPDGTNNSTKITGGTSSGMSRDSILSVSASSAYTVSIFAKKGSTDSFRLELGSGGNALITNFNLTTKTFSSISALGFFTSISTSYVDYPNGWVKVNLSGTTDGTASGNLNLAVYGVSSGYVYFWGVQTEQGSFATSLIPTAGTTVTRAADVSTSALGVDSWYNQDEGTMFSQTSSVTNLQSTTTRPIYGIIKDSSNAHNMAYRAGGFDDFSQQTVINGALVFTPVDSGDPNFVNDKVGYAYSSTGGSAVHNSQVTSSSTNDLSVIAPIILKLGYSSVYLNGHIKRLAYFPTRLPDATLQNITS